MSTDWMRDRKLVRQYHRECLDYGPTLAPYPIPPPNNLKEPLRAWRSREYFVQLYWDPSSLPRLTINRCRIKAGGWEGGISWDTIQRLKREAGYGDSWAVECYPPDNQVVNVANLRHLFLLPERPAYGWVK